MNQIKIIVIVILLMELPTNCRNSDTIARVRKLYLNIMKNTILNTIYEPAEFKEDGTQWPKIAHSMVGKKRMENIQFCVEDVLKKNIPGDLVETGVWRGGATIFMRAILKAYNITDRVVWVADSFEGLPKESYEQDQDFPPLYTVDFLKVSLEQVQENFKTYDLLDDQVKFLKGYFKDTMPNNQIGQLAVLRLDGDMYESTIQVLEALYDKVSVGGYIIIDDYSLVWARNATHDFRTKRNITEPIINIDNVGAYWKKMNP